MTGVADRGRDGIGQDAIGPRSPLHDILSRYPHPLPTHPASGHFDLAIGERAFLGKVLVMGSGELFHARAAAQLGFNLPQAPNTTEAQGDVTAMWLSPREWMVVTPSGREFELLVALQQALADSHALVIDASDRWTVITVAGRKAESVLSKGTSVQLGPTTFGKRRCYQTRLFSMPVIINPRDALMTFDVFVDCTYSEHLWDWLQHAADGLGLQVFAPPS